MADPEREKALRDRARGLTDQFAKRLYRIACEQAILAALKQTAEEEYTRGIQDVLMIRCMQHFRVPQHNRNEIRGAECGECVRQGERKRADGEWSGAVTLARAEGERAGREGEREACAKIAEAVAAKHHAQHGSPKTAVFSEGGCQSAQEIADLIRSRSSEGKK